MSMDLNELADRVERAAVDEQGSMILLALEAAFPKPASDYQPRREPNFSPEWSAWAKLDAKVRNFVQMGAFLDAAMTLVPPSAVVGVLIDAIDRNRESDWVVALPRYITAAALRTKALGAVHTLTEDN